MQYQKSATAGSVVRVGSSGDITRQAFHAAGIVAEPACVTLFPTGR